MAGPTRVASTAKPEEQHRRANQVASELGHVFFQEGAPLRQHRTPPGGTLAGRAHSASQFDASASRISMGFEVGESMRSDSTPGDVHDKSEQRQPAQPRPLTREQLEQQADAKGKEKVKGGGHQGDLDDLGPLRLARDRGDRIRQSSRTSSSSG